MTRARAATTPPPGRTSAPRSPRNRTRRPRPVRNRHRTATPTPPATLTPYRSCDPLRVWGHYRGSRPPPARPRRRHRPRRPGPPPSLLAEECALPPGPPPTGAPPVRLDRRPADRTDTTPVPPSPHSAGHRTRPRRATASAGSSRDRPPGAHGGRTTHPAGVRPSRVVRNQRSPWCSDLRLPPGPGPPTPRSGVRRGGTGSPASSGPRPRRAPPRGRRTCSRCAGRAPRNQTSATVASPRGSVATPLAARSGPGTGTTSPRRRSPGRRLPPAPAAGQRAPAAVPGTRGRHHQVPARRVELARLPERPPGAGGAALPAAPARRSPRPPVAGHQGVHGRLPGPAHLVEADRPGRPSGPGPPGPA